MKLSRLLALGLTLAALAAPALGIGPTHDPFGVATPGAGSTTLGIGPTHDPYGVATPRSAPGG